MWSFCSYRQMSIYLANVESYHSTSYSLDESQYHIILNELSFEVTVRCSAVSILWMSVSFLRLLNISQHIYKKLLKEYGLNLYIIILFFLRTPKLIDIKK